MISLTLDWSFPAGFNVDADLLAGSNKKTPRRNRGAFLLFSGSQDHFTARQSTPVNVS
jgi:hypothetical protein